MIWSLQLCHYGFEQRDLNSHYGFEQRDLNSQREKFLTKKVWWFWIDGFQVFSTLTENWKLSPKKCHPWKLGHEDYTVVSNLEGGGEFSKK